jgi:putative transposase
MEQPQFKVWLHVILATKNRQELIKPLIEPILHQVLADTLTEQGCEVKAINGTENHVHLLFLLNPQRTLAEVIKNLKTHSAYHINQENLSNAKFGWSAGCGAFSIGESFVEKTEQYINDQKKTHQDIDFQQEYEKILKRHSLNLE